MFKESGRFTTFYLRALLTQRAAAPGDRVSLRVEGTDAGSMTRGKLLSFEQERDGDWHPVGAIVAARDSDGPSRWVPPGSGRFMVTREGYRGTTPLFFDAPPVPLGEYRVRLDLTHGNAEIGDLRDRTATIYASLRVLATSENE